MPFAKAKGILFYMYAFVYLICEMTYININSMITCFTMADFNDRIIDRPHWRTNSRSSMKGIVLMTDFLDEYDLADTRLCQSLGALIDQKGLTKARVIKDSGINRKFL